MILWEVCLLYFYFSLCLSNTSGVYPFVLILKYVGRSYWLFLASARQIFFTSKKSPAHQLQDPAFVFAEFQMVKVN